VKAHDQESDEDGDETSHIDQSGISKQIVGKLVVIIRVEKRADAR
jgi:hypothetical protein